MKKIFLVLLGLMFLSSARLVQASVIINEVQLSPTENRFIELYNPDSSAVDLTDWYIQRKTATGSIFGSLITKTNFENKTINANGYFLISKTSLNNSDIILDTLTLTESNSIQIKNQSGEVVDKLSWGESNECTGSCSINPTEGSSLQKLNDGSWVVATPTPGVQNQSSNNNNENNNNTNDTNTTNTTTNTTTTTVSSSGGSGSSSKPKVKIIENPTMKVDILTNEVAFVGQATEFNASVLGYSNEKVVLGKLFWNFGDGTSLEQLNKFEKFNHTYLYPGEYPVSLEYYPNNFTNTRETLNKVIVKVIPLTVSISKVGDIKDFFIELTNNASSDIDISNWALITNEKKFVFPKNSVIMAKKQMTIPGIVTGFVLADKENLKLKMPTGEVVFSYSSPSLAINKIVTKKYEPIIETSLQENEQNSEIQIPNEDLSASAILSNDISQKSSEYLFFIGFAVLLGISGSAIYFLRRKKIIKNTGDDFEILDE